MAIEEVRIDKWLWAVRIFKTRSQASEACKKGKVIINEVPVKPSRIIKVGECVNVKKMPVIYIYKVVGIISKRVSAKIAQEHFDNLTTEEELNKLNFDSSGFFVRDKGLGRPTKKERRIIDKVKNNDNLK